MENVEAWSEVVSDVLLHVPADKRLAVLDLAKAKEEHEAAERSKNADFRILRADDLEEATSLGMRHWNAIVRLKSLLVHVFVREIANEHSPEEASSILFAPHAYGTGSGSLADYIPRIVTEPEP